MLATLPIAHEIACYPIRPEANDSHALFFALPCDTPGMRFLCRESFDYGRSHFDHPLGSRFEELDAVVLFDDVLVPWEKKSGYSYTGIWRSRTGLLPIPTS